MTDCKCCNDLGSSPKYQLFLTISVAVLTILLALYGISLLLVHNYGVDFYEPSLLVTYYAGLLMSIVWLVTCISRCCAPCCCQLSDVPCPCPCTFLGLLDLCFYVGFVVATWPVNLSFMADSQAEQGDYTLLDTVPWEFTDVVLLLGILILCSAIPLGCVKFKKMQETARENTYPVQSAPQVVGNAVAVKEVPV